jgi:sigma-B regulation protein RsbU (phosphoserine phosphatase)
MPTAWRAHRNYIWVLPLCAAALFYQVTSSVIAVISAFNLASIPNEPFLSADGTAVYVSKEAVAAGLHEGDRILAIDGKPVTNVRELIREIERHKPGESLAVTGQPKGQATTRILHIPLRGLAGAGTTIGGIALWIGISAVMLVCVFIGVYVAIRRPDDKRALLAFSLMLSLAQVVNIVDWFLFPEPLWVFAHTWRLLCVLNWSIAITAFGLYFPERFEWDRRRPWLKWLYFGPLIAVNAFILFAATVPEFSFRTYARLNSIVAPLINSSSILTAISIALFFAAMGCREGKATTRDAKRRLRLLQVGAGIGLVPIGLLVLFEVFGRVRADAGLPEALTITACVLFVIFPVTLAYSVLTERAMNLSVVIRQGMRYTLARGGLRVLILVLSSLFFWRLSVFLSRPTISQITRIVVLVAAIAIMVFVIRRVRSQLFQAIDRKFFREQYQSEAVLSDLSERVRTIVDEKQLFETVTRCVSDALHVSHSCVLANSNGLLRPVFVTGLAIPDHTQLPEDSKAVEVVADSKEPPPIYFDRPDNWVHQTPEHELVTLRTLGAQLLLPLKSKDKVLGLLCLGPKLSEEPFSKTDINLLRSVALQTGLALENSRLAAAIVQEVAQRERLNREIEIAREVQERLFPQQLPVVAGIDYSGACRPALGVGGDYYDFLKLPNGDLGVAIGDVSGKGIAAALLMASLQASLRSQALSGTTDLAQLMSNVNRLVYDATPSNRYATFFYGQYEQATRTFRYVNAGHNPPFVLRQTSGGTVHVIRLDAGGPVVGLFAEAPYQQGSLKLESCDVFVGFTDGISEAMNRAEEEWGEEQLIPAVAAHADKPAREIIPNLMADADRFVDGAPQHDDMTMVVMKMQ